MTETLTIGDMAIPKSNIPRSLNSSETMAKTRSPRKIETAEAIGLKRTTVNSRDLDAVLSALEQSNSPTGQTHSQDHQPRRHRTLSLGRTRGRLWPRPTRSPRQPEQRRDGARVRAYRGVEWRWSTESSELAARSRVGCGVTRSLSCRLAHRERQLELEDLERLAVAAYMVGRDDASDEAWVAAHHAWLRRGDVRSAARCAFGHALGLFFRGELAPAMGWVARGGRLLAESRRDCVEQAWLQMLTALPRLFEGDAEVAPIFAEAGEMAERFADADASMFARLGRGYALIGQGRGAEGMALLDEAMVSVTADEVAPMLAGIAYCQVIALCQAVFDLRRAREWTEALARWCDAQPGLVPFRGNCLVHRCEIFSSTARGQTPSILHA